MIAKSNHNKLRAEYIILIKIKMDNRADNPLISFVLLR